MTTQKLAKRWTAKEEAEIRSVHSRQAIEHYGLPTLIAYSRQSKKCALARLARKQSPLRRNGTFKALP
jgi:hypothetical protein